MIVLVDSDIVIEVFRGRNTSLVSDWNELGRSASLVLCSPVTVAEVWAGARPKEHDKLSALLSGLRCIQIGERTGYLAGQYLNRFSKSHGLRIGDALIAACAVTLNAHLWTRNRKHYPMEEVTFFD